MAAAVGGAPLALESNSGDDDSAAASAVVLVAASGEAAEGGGEGESPSSFFLLLLLLGVGEDGGFNPSYLQRHQEINGSIRGQILHLKCP